jgi:glycosyltransferase involved in cell wall biosynthesis
VVFAGKPGPGFEYIQREVQATCISDRVIFLGFVPDEDLPDLYGKCTVFIFPSRYEGFGLPVIEAMAWGAPVITARNSGLIEAAGNAGLLYDADDIQGMAQAVEKIFNDKLYRQHLIRLGREHALRFSWEENCRQWKEVINSFDWKNRKS